MAANDRLSDTYNKQWRLFTNTTATRADHARNDSEGPPSISKAPSAICTRVHVSAPVGPGWLKHRSPFRSRHPSRLGGLASDKQGLGGVERGQGDAAHRGRALHLGRMIAQRPMALSSAGAPTQNLLQSV